MTILLDGKLDEAAIFQPQWSLMDPFTAERHIALDEPVGVPNLEPTTDAWHVDAMGLLDGALIIIMVKMYGVLVTLSFALAVRSGSVSLRLCCRFCLRWLACSLVAWSRLDERRYVLSVDGVVRYVGTEEECQRRLAVLFPKNERADQDKALGRLWRTTR